MNEAELRGIKMTDLRKELFTSREHLDMVFQHEIRASQYWQTHREIERPPAQKIPEKVKSVKPSRMVRQSNNYLFTPKQIQIAEAIFRKEKTK